MATVAFFHAHPDDECIATGGTMARLADEGHKVVLITATRGELGEVADGVLADGEELWQRREQELFASARVLGVSWGGFLGYRDSGMIDTEGNADPRCFWQADVEEAAQKVAAMLAEHDVDAFVVYDENGNYGHPDHIQVHRVGTRAAQIAGTKALYQATINRDALVAMMKAMVDQNEGEVPEGAPNPDEMTFGMPADMIDRTLDVSAWAARKREAMRCHESQIGDTSFFMTMTDEIFALAFGSEWFITSWAPDDVAIDALV